MSKEENQTSQYATHKVVCKKLGMSTHFDMDSRRLIPVTILEYQPTRVLRKGNYYSTAFVEGIRGKLSKPNAGQLKKYGITAQTGKFVQLKGAPLESQDNVILLSNFKTGALVDVQGTSKGKGFCGVMKRWGFSGLPGSHGTSVSHRSAGSTGSQDIGRVRKGQKMAGRDGNKKVTVHNLQILFIDEDNNIIAVKGSAPGVSGGTVFMRHAIRKCLNQNPHKNNPLAKAELQKEKI